MEENMKLEAMHQGLIRRGLITEDNKVTPLGDELLAFLKTKIAKTIVRKKETSSEFNEWWEAFPLTDHFEYKGRIFTGSRKMRVQTEKCALKFNQIVNDGLFTARQIIEATKYVILLRKEASLKKKSNELTYMHNSYTFLDMKDFEPFVKLVEQGVKITESNNEQTTGGVTDI